MQTLCGQPGDQHVHAVHRLWAGLATVEQSVGHAERSVWRHLYHHHCVLFLMRITSITITIWKILHFDILRQEDIYGMNGSL